MPSPFVSATRSCCAEATPVAEAPRATAGAKLPAPFPLADAACLPETRCRRRSAGTSGFPSPSTSATVALAMKSVAAGLVDGLERTAREPAASGVEQATTCSAEPEPASSIATTSGRPSLVQVGYVEGAVVKKQAAPEKQWTRLIAKLPSPLDSSQVSINLFRPRLRHQSRSIQRAVTIEVSRYRSGIRIGAVSEPDGSENVPSPAVQLDRGQESSGQRGYSPPDQACRRRRHQPPPAKRRRNEDPGSEAPFAVTQKRIGAKSVERQCLDCRHHSGPRGSSTRLPHSPAESCGRCIGATAGIPSMTCTSFPKLATMSAYHRG